LRAWFSSSLLKETLCAWSGTAAYLNFLYSTFSRSSATLGCVELYIPHFSLPSSPARLQLGEIRSSFCFGYRVIGSRSSSSSTLGEGGVIQGMGWDGGLSSGLGVLGRRIDCFGKKGDTSLCRQTDNSACTAHAGLFLTCRRLEDLGLVGWESVQATGGHWMSGSGWLGYLLYRPFASHVISADEMWIKSGSWILSSTSSFIPSPV
jgi:hypothetical protein